LVPKNGEWGWDVPGSPSWANTFHHENGEPVHQDIAKSIFRKGFSLQNLVVVYIDAMKDTGDKNKPHLSKSMNNRSWDATGASIIKKVFIQNNKDTRSSLDYGADASPLFKLIYDANLDYGADANPLFDFIYDAKWATQRVFKEDPFYEHSKCPGLANGTTIESEGDMREPQFTCWSHRIGNFYYIRIVLGPLDSYMCWPIELGWVVTPVDVRISMELKNGAHSSRFATHSQLGVDHYLSFADRIPVLKEDDHPQLQLAVSLKSTSNCPSIESLKEEDPFAAKENDNPFEQQIEKEIEEEWVRVKNQASSLGAIEVKAYQATLKAWDHMQEDGDRVRISLNGAVVRDDMTLYNDPEVVALRLKKGINYVKITALNTGDSGTNTAAFTVSENGKVILSKTWSLESYETGILHILKSR
jgi:hypothetical protein